MKSVVAVAAAAAFFIAVAQADVSSRASAVFYFLGPWEVQETKDGLLRQLQLNFTAGVDEWRVESAVFAADEEAGQLGIISVHAEDNGQVSVWATPGLLHGEAALADKVEVDADGDFPAGEHAALSALEHILDFTWTAVHVGGEPSKEGKHLAAGASGPLASTQAGTFHIQRVPVGTKHGTEGAAVHHSDVGDILALTVAGASTQTQWVAVRGKDASTATFWQSYQWWIMGAIFVANLGLRSWARGRGRGDAPAADSGKPSMQQAREARRSKSKSS